MVPRVHLIGALTAQPRRPVVSVIAPPGYGKTVLLADWARSDDRPVAWLTLDDGDNVPSVFLTYLAAAIDRIEPIDPAIRASIAAPGSRVLAAAVPRLAAALHGIGRPAVLVLDDAHRLVDRTCLDALTVLLDHLPADLQVALAARAMPDLPFARLRAGRELLEIAKGDLAMDVDETAALASAAGQTLGLAEARLFAERTEGWAAGIYLATIARARSGRPASAGDALPGRDDYIADYLRSELLPTLSPDDLTFLTRTSILEVVEPEVAAVVTGLPGAAERLRSLAAGNQLIGGFAGRGEAYRYHNLLRAFLRSELERGDPGIVPQLHRAAATWYASAGRTEVAIEHALMSDDVEAAAALVTAALLPELYGGNADKLDRWLGSFDESAFLRHPPLAVVGAWVHLLNGRAEAAERLAGIAERASFAGVPGDGSASYESSRCILRAVMASHGPAAMLADASVAVAAEAPGSPWRTNALLMFGSAHLLLGDEVEADAALTRSVEAGGKAGTMVAWATRASLAIARRDWASAERYARESRAMLEAAQLDNIVASLLTHAVSARIAIHQRDLRRARAELVQAQLIRPLASYAAPWFAVVALLELAQAYLGLADAAGARNVVAEAEAIAHRRPDLGILGGRLAEMRHRLRDAAGTLAGASALTTAELRLLPILSTPLTFREIGERVFLSPHTVKTQAISIYGKLGASSRSEAVERAIELGLLEPFPGLPPTSRPPTP
jgi:LuxR family maltose regulon positive regulatory protein